MPRRCCASRACPPRAGSCRSLSSAGCGPAAATRTHSSRLTRRSNSPAGAMSSSVWRRSPLARAEAHWLEGSRRLRGRRDGSDARAGARDRRCVGDRRAVRVAPASRDRGPLRSRLGRGAVRARAERATGTRRPAPGTALGCPYEAALARADSGEEAGLREALAVFQHLGAVPATRDVTQRLRSAGVRKIARGPRRSTINNPASSPRARSRSSSCSSPASPTRRSPRGSTSRPRPSPTTSRRCSRKLGVRSRRQAAAEAARLGLGCGER